MKTNLQKIEAKFKAERIAADKKEYRQSLIGVLSFFVILLGFAAFISFDHWNAAHPKMEKLVTIYYDGEGNQLPDSAVQTLVRSQYVITTKSEDSVLIKYFK